MNLLTVTIFMDRRDRHNPPHDENLIKMPKEIGVSEDDLETPVIKRAIEDGLLAKDSSKQDVDFFQRFKIEQLDKFSSICFRAGVASYTDMAKKILEARYLFEEDRIDDTLSKLEKALELFKKYQITVFNFILSGGNFEKLLKGAGPEEWFLEREKILDRAKKLPGFDSSWPTSCFAALEKDVLERVEVISPPALQKLFVRMYVQHVSVPVDPEQALLEIEKRLEYITSVEKSLSSTNQITTGEVASDSQGKDVSPNAQFLAHVDMRYLEALERIVGHDEALKLFSNESQSEQLRTGYAAINGLTSFVVKANLASLGEREKLPIEANDHAQYAEQIGDILNSTGLNKIARRVVEKIKISADGSANEYDDRAEIAMPVPGQEYGSYIVWFLAHEIAHGVNALLSSKLRVVSRDEFKPVWDELWRVTYEYALRSMHVQKNTASSYAESFTLTDSRFSKKYLRESFAEDLAMFLIYPPQVEPRRLQSLEFILKYLFPNIDFEVVRSKVQSTLGNYFGLSPKDVGTSISHPPDIQWYANRRNRKSSKSQVKK